VTEGQWQLTEAEEREIERLREELGTNFCQRCDYCQACVREIPISTVMNARSSAQNLAPEELFSGELAEAVEKAANCSQCGDCEERCPFQLPVIEMLTEQVKWYQEEKDRYRQQATNRPT